MFSLRNQFAFVVFFLPLPVSGQTQQARIVDDSHYSQEFQELRNFRVFLPPSYDAANCPKRYPVVYFFHGWGERYNQASAEVGNYDTGYNGDNLSSYVGTHDLIVVKWDGFNPRYPGDTYARPYNIGPVETSRQFPLYFPELVRHIDSKFCTIADRDHRGISGVSMGGFMSYWVAGKYPHLAGSASSFMPSPEFLAGTLAAPTEYSHTPMHRNYEGVRTRLTTGAQDFIRWYHQRMNATWLFTRPHHEVDQFVSTHGTPGMAKTLDFHMKAFSAPLPKPKVWHHADLYPNFDVWGYSVSSNRQGSGFTILEDVSTSGFRSSVREWLPDGNLLSSVTLRVTTDAVYVPGQLYWVSDVNLEDGQVRRTQLVAPASGRLTFEVTGDRHEIGISPLPDPIVTVAGWRLAGNALPLNGKPVRIKLKLLNKGDRDAPGVRAHVQSPNPQVTIQQGSLTLPYLAAGAMEETADELQFIVTDPQREIVKLQVQIDVEGRSALVPVEIPVFADTQAPANLVINDGARVMMWERATAKALKSMGTGNGDGLANPGEMISLLLPDAGGYRAGEIFSFDSCLESSRASAGQYVHWRLSDYWGEYDNVGASVKYSLPIIPASCPPGHQITFYVRYQMPNRPEHILKEGIVNVTVTRLNRWPPRRR